jgi:hypothetical protein
VPFSLPPSFPSLFCPSSLHAVFAFTFAFVAPSSPPLPLFPLACHVCICICGGVLSSLPSLAPSLAYTTASLPPAPCSHSWLAPLQSPHCALFTFMTPLVIVFIFMTGPLPFVFTTVSVFVCRAGLRRPHLCPCHGILVRYVIGTPILVLVLSLILALILTLVPALALHWSTTPMPTSGVHHVFVFVFTVSCVCIHGPSRSLSRSLVLAFMVPRTCFHGPLHLLSRPLALACTAPHTCFHGPSRSHSWSPHFVFVVHCVCVHIHDRPLAFAFTTPLAFVPLSCSRLPPSLAVTCVGYLDRL